MALDGVAITIPAGNVKVPDCGSDGLDGKLSVNAKSDTGNDALLVMVKVSTLVLPGPMVLGAKILENVTGTWAFAAAAKPSARAVWRACLQSL